ncbi:hypothetical protein C1645_824039 [Glomus cerebriforme]|uniref:J domain-containing protein n=1 Tax=Glomus cerebriforme TaxID=658196 RepID=A0A397SUX7_9GLOM|nr:hypothetical protein C1645_824039 [Glomus cerebriforme]
MSKEIITKQDYQILGIEENSSPGKITDAYDKIVLECCPEAIRKNQNREPNQVELEKDSGKNFSHCKPDK